MSFLYQVVGVLVSMFLVDRMGRKGLLIISTSGSAISIFALGTFFYIYENKCPERMPNEECTDGFSPDLIGSLKWMPVVSTKIYKLSS